MHHEVRVAIEPGRTTRPLPGARQGGVRTPTITLTARTHEAEKIMGLDLGADDYVTKPFSPRELRTRVSAVLRRTAEGPGQFHRLGDCEVDLDVGRGGPAQARFLTSVRTSVRGMGYWFDG